MTAELVELSGWGRTAPTAAKIVKVKSEEELVRALADPSADETLARGLGRAYGDAAQIARGRVLDLNALDAVEDIDHEAGTATVGAGCSVGELLRALVPLGWLLPVIPGTRHVTVGGAIAADIHGKNHHNAGSFGRHVLSFGLCLPGGDRALVSPADDPEAFWATVGGMGLTGVVSRATIRLLPIDSAWMRARTECAGDLEDCMARLAARDNEFRYSVAWVDCFSKGRKLGRSVLSFGDHAPRDELPAPLAPSADLYDPRALGTVPRWVPDGLVNPLTTAVFNELWFRKAALADPDSHQSIPAFFHPLDAVSGWNRIYGRPGFVQYQFVVPFGAEDVVRAAVEGVSTRRLPCFLTVLKRFGGQGDGHLSFPKAGWTLAMDFPARAPGLPPFLARLDERVAEAGGRVYLAKDSRMPARHVPAMYARLEEWREVRDRLDPDRRLTSALAQRLELVG